MFFNANKPQKVTNNSNNQKIQKIQEIYKDEMNNECFDCGKSNPEFISANNGVFLCSKCINIHYRFSDEVSLIIKNNLFLLNEKQINYIYYGGNRNLLEFINNCFPLLQNYQAEIFYKTQAMQYYRDQLFYLVEGGPKPIKPNNKIGYKLINNTNYSKTEKREKKMIKNIINEEDETDNKKNNNININNNINMNINFNDYLSKRVPFKRKLNNENKKIIYSKQKTSTNDNMNIILPGIMTYNLKNSKININNQHDNFFAEMNKLFGGRPVLEENNNHTNTVVLYSHNTTNGNYLVNNYSLNSANCGTETSSYKNFINNKVKINNDRITNLKYKTKRRFSLEEPDFNILSKSQAFDNSNVFAHNNKSKNFFTENNEKSFSKRLDNTYAYKKNYNTNSSPETEFKDNNSLISKGIYIKPHLMTFNAKYHINSPKSYDKKKYKLFISNTKNELKKHKICNSERFKILKNIKHEFENINPIFQTLIVPESLSNEKAKKRKAKIIYKKNSLNNIKTVTAKLSYNDDVNNHDNEEKTVTSLENNNNNNFNSRAKLVEEGEENDQEEYIENNTSIKDFTSQEENNNNINNDNNNNNIKNENNKIENNKNNNNINNNQKSDNEKNNKKNIEKI